MKNVRIFVFQDTVIATGNGNLLYVTDGDKITLEITGTATSHTVIFEGLMPSGAYYAIRGTRQSDGTVASQSVALDELWLIDLTPYMAIRARVHAIAGGNITVNSKLTNSNG